MHVHNVKNGSDNNKTEGGTNVWELFRRLRTSIMVHSQNTTIHGKVYLLYEGRFFMFAELGSISIHLLKVLVSGLKLI